MRTFGKGVTTCVDVEKHQCPQKKTSMLAASKISQHTIAFISLTEMTYQKYEIG